MTLIVVIEKGRDRQLAREKDIENEKSKLRIGTCRMGQTGSSR
jgi:hypothetical protein